MKHLSLSYSRVLNYSAIVQLLRSSLLLPELDHPLAPADILKKLASDRELDVRAAIASNIETPISVLEQLA